MTGESDMLYWLIGACIFSSLLITFIMFQVWDHVDNDDSDF